LPGIRRRRKLSEAEVERFYLWLHEYPGYRDLIRQRISTAQKEIKRRDNVREARAVDRLGREVEGCG
jgi:hypothetical protein